MKRAYLFLLPLMAILLGGCKAVESELGITFNTPSRTRQKLAGLKTVGRGETEERVLEKAGYPLETKAVESYELWEWKYMFRISGGWAVFKDGHVVETGWKDHEDPDRRSGKVWLSKGERLMGGPNGKLAAGQRRVRYLELKPELPVKTREMIANGEIGKGMAPGDVVASWGEPDKKKTIEHDYGRVEQWAYGRIDVFFEEGAVSVWQVPE